jgi:hypothetical protein
MEKVNLPAGRLSLAFGSVFTMMLGGEWALGLPRGQPQALWARLGLLAEGLRSQARPCRGCLWALDLETSTSYSRSMERSWMRERIRPIDSLKGTSRDL